MRKSAIAAFVLGAVVATAGGVVLSRPPDGSEQARPTPSRDVVELAERTRKLQEKTEDLERRLSAVDRDPTAQPEVNDVAKPPQPSPSIEERRRRDELMTAAAKRAMEAALTDQSFDPVWTDELNHALGELLDQDDFTGTAVAGVRCAQELCRVRLEHESREAFNRFRDEGLSSTALRGNVFFDYDTETRKTLVYHAKIGTELPRPDVRDFREN